MISKSMLRLLKIIRDFGQGTPPTYMPFIADNQRTADACERRGLIVYNTVDQGSSYNGYSLTDLGREQLKKPVS